MSGIFLRTDENGKIQNISILAIRDSEEGKIHETLKQILGPDYEHRLLEDHTKK